MLSTATFSHADSQSHLEKYPRLSTSKTTSVKTNGRPSSACLKLEHKHDTHTQTTKSVCSKGFSVLLIQMELHMKVNKKKTNTKDEAKW